MASGIPAVGVLISIAALVAVTGCASGGTPAKPSASPPEPPAASTAAGDPEEVARAFWAALASRDWARAAELASFPFDLDAHNGCVESKQELLDLLAKTDLPPGMRIEIGEVREIPVDKPVANPAPWPDDHWRQHLGMFTAADAKCLGPAEAAPVYRYYFVAFSVGGRAVGSLTRLRCRGASCAVAGTDN
jgi:hypothetical protein